MAIFSITKEASEETHPKKHIGGLDITVAQSLQVGQLCHY
jgi:hypothetical protein